MIRKKLPKPNSSFFNSTDGAFTNGNAGGDMHHAPGFKCMFRTGILKRNAFGLLDVRKIIAMERSWNANERFSDLRPFARYNPILSLF